MDLDASLITGGAGFIGSHITDSLVSKKIDVKVIDNLSNGSLNNLSFCKGKKNFSFVKADLANFADWKKIIQDIKIVFHIAAYPEVRTGFDQPELCYNENTKNTFLLLEQIRKSNVEKILFASSSTIYGEPKLLPTPEDYAPLKPISHYGASKLACEAMISSYCHTYGLSGQVFRFANIIGSRSSHGVILDFILKLKKNKHELEVLGDGTQSKSYLHVSDCIDAMLLCLSKSKEKVEIFNLGNMDDIGVLSIAKIVCKSMKLEGVDIQTSGGVDNGRGWIGDVKKMNLDISKLKNLGFLPKLSSEKAVERATKELIADLERVKIGS